MNPRLALVLIAATAAALSSCATSQQAAADNSPAVQARNAAILSEPRGDWFIGRRYFTQKCRYWGYLRRPGQLWDSSRLVVMDESRGTLNPDRVPESPSDASRAHGFDHNAEYRVWGSFSNRTCYDPNADLELPIFIPKRFELISERPGFLFSPRDRYDPRYLPAREAPNRTEAKR
jgi:hypothetical protein